jgi:hypothetical protein
MHVLDTARINTQHLQSVLFVIMDDIKRNIKVLLDDCLLNCTNEDDLLVLCVAKEKSSVNIICRRFSYIFTRESPIWQIRLAQRLTQDVATLYER